MPFEAIHEGWSIYKTRDGATIKLKIVTLKLFLEQFDESGNAIFGAASRVLLAVAVAPSMKGPPSDRPISPKEVAESIIEPDVPFDTVKEEWNEYKVDGAVVSVKLVATIISKSSKFDMNGDPVYNIQHQPIVKGNVPPEARKKFLKIMSEKKHK